MLTKINLKSTQWENRQWQVVAFVGARVNAPFVVVQVVVKRALRTRNLRMWIQIQAKSRVRHVVDLETAPDAAEPARTEEFLKHSRSLEETSPAGKPTPLRSSLADMIDTDSEKP
jgi:hypothetical protein